MTARHLKIEYEALGLQLAQDRDHRRSSVNTMTKLPVPLEEENFLTS